MAERTKDGRIREIYELGEGVEEEIEAIRERTGAKDRSELLRKALHTYDWVIARQKQGFAIQLVKDDRVFAVNSFLETEN